MTYFSCLPLCLPFNFQKEEMHLKDLVFNSKLGLNVVAPFFSGGFAGPIADDLVTGGFNSAKEKIERFISLYKLK